ncbi:hypothetical protein LMG28138_04795 [Pararobbsia alpina]|uniref:NAD-dependent epimerase/dehydratase domain-containing protein n=1 Tax=Pararobbsia alpina TaxID=621374 RepID=A0A6S7BH30_9BURK|nr:hypothetical protein LMG28138_04795 [Pararobbsia alpina]
MTHRVWLAGASGAIGTSLAPLLIAAGYTVFGSTGRADRANAFEEAGVSLARASTRQAGVYNIAQDNAEADSAKAKRELGWSPELRLASRP